MEDYFKELLIRYGDHAKTCPARIDDAYKCDCGWYDFGEIRHIQMVREAAEVDYDDDEDDYRIQE